MHQDIRNQIKKIRIISKKLMNSHLSGDYISAFKGSGIEFHQLRDYVPGDDPRLIDWNSSLRSDKLMVKQFIEERDRTVIVMIDISASTFFSSNEELKRDLALNLAATLMHISCESNDRIGALLFSDIIEEWIPPKRGMTHLVSLLEKILTHKPQSTGSDLTKALRFTINLKQSNAIIFCISDWIVDVESSKTILSVMRRKHDFIAIRTLDNVECAFPDVGLIECRDPETGNVFLIDSRKSKNISLNLKTRLIKQEHFFRKLNIDFLDVKSGEPFIPPLASFFHKRVRRTI
jgi:uncharacterized protein (DUF58 family)